MTQHLVEFHVGDVIRKLREAKDWTQDDLAKTAGTNKSVIGKLENFGTRSDQKTIANAAKALGVSVGELYDRVEYANPTTKQRELWVEARGLSDQAFDFLKRYAHRLRDGVVAADAQPSATSRDQRDLAPPKSKAPLRRTRR